MELAGRKALLTGATGGLGMAIAKALAERGAILALSARKREALEALAAELPGDGHTRPARRPGRGRRGRAARRRGRRGRHPPRQRRPARRRPHGGLHRRAGEASAAGQPRVADAAGAGALPGDAGARLRPPRLRRLAGRQVAGPALLDLQRDQVRPARLRPGLRTDLAPQGIGVSLVSPGFIREAGMFAESGAKSPPGLGTSHPGAGRRRRRCERSSPTRSRSPWPQPAQRFLAHFGLASPGSPSRSRAARPARSPPPRSPTATRRQALKSRPGTPERADTQNGGLIRPPFVRAWGARVCPHRLPRMNL